ncbi:MAG TPA: YfhJ family protein [Candidatus Kurthia intestinigallinarum]|nr:YfhJ family protein [Candidatus Kurthia intestinigallinarum]
MQEIEQKVAELTEVLVEASQLSQAKARIWIELLWSDFESTYAKAGYDYKGMEMTERIIRQWIQSYGRDIHAFAGRNPKYAHLLDDVE